MNLSIQARIGIVVVLVFLSLSILTSWFTVKSERALVEDLAIEQTKKIAQNYFDGLNTLMLSGSMRENEVWRKKIKAHENVEEVRLIRSALFVQTYGQGSQEQYIVDPLDKRALTGETVVQVQDIQGHRVISVLEPIMVKSNFNGTNCLSCHAFPEGSVVGAVRVDYSLAQLDTRITHNLQISVLINITILLLGLFIIIMVIRQVVLIPLYKIRDSMQVVKNNSDLTVRNGVTSQDEIGDLAEAFNDLLSNFSKSLGLVSNTTKNLSSVTQRIVHVASQTKQVASEQRIETDNVTKAILALEKVVHDVRDSANSAAEASVQADQTASAGAKTTQQAINGILDLVSDIDRASEVIKQLDERSKGVSAVLDVIKGIAEQTNLLALNAAIEAARAGEQGRGFAVVADEVRTLATRSHQSTEQIEKIIQQLQCEAQDAVNVMLKAKMSAEQRREQVQIADDGLNLIADRVTHIRDLNVRMAKAADDQNEFVDKVSNSVLIITRLANSTAQDATETNTVSLELEQLSRELNKLVEKFHC